jgi:N-acyl-D-aspartate/D-glutamate deacylase
VQGNCGFGIAPTRPSDRQAIMETLENVEGMNLATLEAGIDWSFESFPEYWAQVAARPKRINLASFVGHTPLRIYTMGPEAAVSREANPEEIGQMRALVAEAMASGAIGLSTSQAPSHVGFRGLPVPSRLASQAEIEALLTAVGETGRGIVEITYGPQFDITEVAALSKRLGVRMTWGALLTGLHGGPGASLELLEKASAVGGDLWPQLSCREIVFQMSMADPYYFGQAAAFEEILKLPRAERARLYADPAWRERARPDAQKIRPNFPEKASIEETRLHRALRGRPLGEIAAERGVHPLDLALDLALEEDLETRFRIVSRNDDPVELSALLRDPRTLLGAHDAGAHVDMLCDSLFPTHLLSHWVREQGVLTLEEAVWRLSGQPAEVFRIRDRGRVAPGYFADLVAFDPARVAPQPIERVYDFPAKGERLVAGSIGIEHVWVNGKPIRSSGKDLPGAAPGVAVHG